LFKTSMSARDLHQDPVWQGVELGQPIPASPHAVSVALPRWQDVVGYEEKKPEVVNALSSGYPRFFIHAQVRELAQQIGEGRPCLPFPSLRAAPACAPDSSSAPAASRRKWWRSAASMAS
jgi:cystathionine gamma-synthase